MSSYALPAYYAHDGQIYADNADMSTQDEARKAAAYVLEMINQNDRARREVETWANDSTEVAGIAAYAITRATLDTVANPWFWVSMSHRPIHLNPGRGFRPGGGCCSGASCDGDTCKAIALVVVIGFLIAAFVASVGLTVKHGQDAGEARQKLNEIKGAKREAQSEDVQNLYNNVIALQHKEWVSQASKTAFTATFSLGVGLLTISAIIALIAAANHVAVPFSASQFASAGGLVCGASLAGHAGRVVVIKARAYNDVRHLHSLYDALTKLEHLHHPYEYLAAQTTYEYQPPLQNAYIEVGETRYIQEIVHEERSYRSEPITHSQSDYADYVNYVLNEREEQ